MALGNGMSEIDTVVLNLPDYGKEIKNWSNYTFNQRFLTPTSGWSFTISDEDTTLTNELLVKGARVELSINDRIQCSGTIDKKTVDSSSESGTKIIIQGRDILAPVVDSNVDPRFKFTASMSILDVCKAVLKPFGIDTIVNSDEANLNVITGFAKGKGAAVGGPTGERLVVKNTTDAKGKVTSSLEKQKDYSAPTTTTRPDLKTLQIQQAKPHMGEGVYAYLDRLLRRLGLTMWALADGSGVVIDKADFSGAANQQLIHKLGDTSRNNILRGRVVDDSSTQPSCIVAFGYGSRVDNEASKLKIIMINELDGLDDAGNPLPEIKNIMTTYKSAKVLSLRKEMIPSARPLGDRKIARILFVKDDESKNLAQLEAYVRREMANNQRKAYCVNYDVVGHTSDGTHPWAVNTIVSVDDDKRGVHENLWVVSKTFKKSNSEGTITSLELIRPFTLQISQ